jgi:hypothetical protein
VLVHGTFVNARDYWITTAPALAAAGYSVFRMDYAAPPAVPFFHAIGSIELRRVLDSVRCRPESPLAKTESTSAVGLPILFQPFE